MPQAVLSEAQAELAAITKDKNKYKALVTDLLVQVCAFVPGRGPMLVGRWMWPCL